MTKIMLVEDDKSLREIYGVRLAAEGYQIISAGDGEEALAMAVKEKPNLIVSDVMMPKISGFDMLDILRATPETKDMKVIMMTALSSDDQRSRGESLGADKYLVKSQVGIEDVIRSVHEVLGDAPIAAEPTPDFGTLAPESTTVDAQQPVAPQPADTSTAEPQADPQVAQPADTPQTDTAYSPAAEITPDTPAVAPEPAMPQPMVPPVQTAPQPVMPPIQQPAPLAPETFAPAAIQTTTVPEPPVVEPLNEPVVPEAATPATAPQPTTIEVQTPPVQTQPQPVVEPTDNMPQPTAPFSTPAPASLGDRVINPVEPSAPKMDIAAMMSKELGDDTTAPTPPSA